MYKQICDSPRLFRIPYNCTYNVLKEKVRTTIPYPSKISINNLYFRRPIMTSEGHTMYEAVELTTDEDAFHMLQSLSCM